MPATRASSGKLSSAWRCSSYSAHMALTASFGSSIDSIPTRSASSRDLRSGFSRNEPCSVSCCTFGNFVTPAASRFLSKLFTSCPTTDTCSSTFAASCSGNLAALPRSWLNHRSLPSCHATKQSAIINTALAWLFESSSTDSTVPKFSSSPVSAS